MDITYSSVLVLTHNKIHVRPNTNISFEFLSHKEKNILALDLQTQPNLQILVTVTNLAFTGWFSYECRYGGVVAGEILGEDYAESQSICQTVKGEMERYFYSHNSSIILLVYWYENYSELKTSMKLSVTKCNPVLLEVNCIDIHCATPVCRKQCVSYLTNITKYSQVHFEYDFSLPGLVYSLADNSCAVVQIVRNHFVVYTGSNFRQKKPKYQVFFIIKMAPIEISQPVKEITYTIRGSLEKNVGEVQDSLVFYQYDSLQRLHETQNEVQDKKPSRYQTMERASGTLGIVMRKHTPLMRDNMNLLLFLVSHSNSWIEIKIDIRNTATVSCCLFSERFPIVPAEQELFTYSQSYDHILLMKLREKKESSFPISFFLMYSLFMISEMHSDMKLPTAKINLLKWHLKDNFTMRNLQELISLPGKVFYASFTFSPKPTQNMTGISLEILWSNNKHQRFSSHYTTFNIFKSSQTTSESKCYFFLSKVRVSHNEFLLCPHCFFHTGGLSLVRLSWEDTFAVCQNIGGDLPYFNSPAEMEEVVAIIKFLKECPPIEGIFLGLVVSSLKVGLGDLWRLLKCSRLLKNVTDAMTNQCERQAGIKCKKRLDSTFLVKIRLKFKTVVSIWTYLSKPNVRKRNW